VRNNTCDDAVGEIRWQVIKAMLDDFPTLKEKAKDYLKEQNRNNLSKKKSFKADFDAALWSQSMLSRARATVISTISLHKSIILI
jgi:hypothetical protein